MDGCGSCIPIAHTLSDRHSQGGEELNVRLRLYGIGVGEGSGGEGRLRCIVFVVVMVCP